MLIDALELSLLINGIYVVFNWDGMILKPFGDLLETSLPEWTCKMTFACATCMSGIYGISYGIGAGYTDFIAICGFVLITAGLSTVINIFLEGGKSFVDLMDYELKEKSGANDLGGTSYH